MYSWKIFVNNKICIHISDVHQYPIISVWIFAVNRDHIHQSHLVSFEFCCSGLDCSYWCVFCSLYFKHWILWFSVFCIWVFVHRFIRATFPTYTELYLHSFMKNLIIFIITIRQKNQTLKSKIRNLPWPNLYASCLAFCNLQKRILYRLHKSTEHFLVDFVVCGGLLNRSKYRWCPYSLLKSMYEYVTTV